MNVEAGGAMRYSPTERAFFIALAILCGAGLNGIFLWASLMHPDWMSAAMQNPVSLAFMLEALIMTGVLAYLLRRWQVSRLHWALFVALALAGGIGFALPVVLLWSGEADRAS